MTSYSLVFVPFALLAWTSCGGGAATPETLEAPFAGAVSADHLIQEGESHFAHLWQLTHGGENAEAYWSADGTQLCLQRTSKKDGVDCDRIYVTGTDGELRQISDGRGVTTCAYFFPDGKRVLFASTTGMAASCPQPPDRSQGYVWPLHEGYDIYVHDLEKGSAWPLISGPGYDAEATISPAGDRIVFTSTRSGDIELWTSDLEGGDLVQVTDDPGYDGGAFFSNDGKKIVFRATAFTPGKEDEELTAYKDLLAQDLVKPSHMELFLVDADGQNRTQLTALGKANFGPSFYPDDSRIIFATNHHDEATPAMDFDLWSIGVDGKGLEQITKFNGGERGKQFDGFPLFSPDGQWLAFSSNRGDGEAGDTNVFVAQWK
jgi:TolB protein